MKKSLWEQCGWVRHPLLVTWLLLSPSPAKGEFIAGTSSAIFVNPLPPGSFVTGVGTSTFSYGDPTRFPTGPSRLSFIGGAFGTVTEADFRIGTLTFFNGTVDPPVPDTVDLRTQLNFTTPPTGTQNSDFRLQLISTPNVGNADENADAVVFPTAFSSTVFTFGTTQYTVQLLGFRNIVGDGFLTSDSFRLNVRENASASAELFGRVTANVPHAVPGPANLHLLCVGAGLLFGYYRLRRK